MTDEFMTTAEAATFLGLAKQTLELWRCTDRYGLPYLKVGRLVRYRRADLVAWLERRRVTHTGVLEPATK